MKNYSTWIESYLNGELSPDERSEFESALKQSPRLAEDLAQHRALIQQLDAMRIRMKVAEALQHPPRARYLWKPTHWLIALLLLAGLGGAWWYYSSKTNSATPAASPALPPNPTPYPDVETPPPPQTPMAQNKPVTTRKNYLALAKTWQREPISGFTRSEQPAVSTRLDSAIMAYENGNYTTALTFLTNNDTDETALFLRGSARMKTGQWRSAAADFSALSNSFQYRHEAQMNLALCLLATNQTGTAVQKLKMMAADSVYPYRQSAAEILQRVSTGQ